MAVNYLTRQSYNPWTANQSLSMAGNVGVGSVAPEGGAALNQSADRFGGAILGAIGSGIDKTRALTGGRFDLGLSENLERLGGMLNPAPVKAADFNESEYRKRGWTDVNAMKADFAATGGPQQSTDPAPFVPTTYTNKYSGTPGTTTKESPDVPTDEEMLKGAYPQTDLGNFDLGADDFMNEIQSQYGARLDYLKGAEEAIRKGQPEILEGIAADLRAGKSKAGTAQQKELGVLKGSEAGATQRKEDALAAARRLYGELRRGGIQRFGGATSAGEAMNTLLGVEQQKQMGQTRRGFAQTMEEIGRRKLDIENQYQDQLKQIEADNVNAVNQANQEFRARLDEVEQNRMLASDAKSQARLGILQDLRDKAFTIQALREQFKQQLDAMRVEQQMSLDTYAKQLEMSSRYGSQAVDMYKQNTSTSPTSRITATGKRGYTPLGITSAVGQIGNLDERTAYLQGAKSYRDDLPVWLQR